MVESLYLDGLGLRLVRGNRDIWDEQWISFNKQPLKDAIDKLSNNSKGLSEVVVDIAGDLLVISGWRPMYDFELGLVDRAHKRLALEQDKKRRK